MEAHHYLKAVQAAIGAEQWARAVSIAATIDPADAAPYLRKVGQHYASARRWPEAEKAFVDGGAPQEAVAMYGKAGEWDKAYRIAKTFMRPHELMHMFVSQAQKAEADAVTEGAATGRGAGSVNVSKLQEAERLLVTVGEVDRAIAMYKKHYLFEDMLRLVREHRSELEVETHLHLARKLEKEGNLAQAEEYFLRAKEWKPCVAMYREHNRWQDCLRVAKEHGGPAAFKQVAYAYATSVGDDAGVKFLAEHNLAEQAVAFAIERGEWDSAFMLAEKSCRHKLPEVHLQRAMAYEDEGRFADAERGFLLANKPREAIEMHIHQKDWTAATRIATQADPSMLPDIAVAQGRAAAEAGAWAQAEAYYLQAQQPQHALTMYREQGRWDDAIRLARQYSQKDVASLETEKLRGTAAAATPDSGDYLLSQARVAESQRQIPAAVDQYLLLAPGHVAAGTQLPSLAALADVLAHATRLATQHLPRQQAQVAVRAAAPKLVAAGAADRAGRALAEVGLVEEALQLLVREDKGDVATELARTYGGYEMVRTVEAMRQVRTFLFLILEISRHIFVFYSYVCCFYVCTRLYHKSIFHLMPFLTPDHRTTCGRTTASRSWPRATRAWRWTCTHRRVSGTRCWSWRASRAPRRCTCTRPTTPPSSSPKAASRPPCRSSRSTAARRRPACSRCCAACRRRCWR